MLLLRILIKDACACAYLLLGPESPVYMYDYRGLRVPRKAGVHVRGGSTPAIMEGATDKQTQGTKFISVCKSCESEHN